MRPTRAADVLRSSPLATSGASQEGVVTDFTRIVGYAGHSPAPPPLSDQAKIEWRLNEYTCGSAQSLISGLNERAGML